jgi:hypothetical protein
VRINFCSFILFLCDCLCDILIIAMDHVNSRIDGLYCCNWTRFFNHSCDGGNLRKIVVSYNTYMYMYSSVDVCSIFIFIDVFESEFNDC